MDRSAKAFDLLGILYAAGGEVGIVDVLLRGIWPKILLMNTSFKKNVSYQQS